MPELPDIAAYIGALTPRVMEQRLTRTTIRSPFLVRTVEPAVHAAEGKKVAQIRRIGKRIAVGFAGGPFLVFHLMIAGRFVWKDAIAKPTGRIDLAAFEFPGGTLVLTEASQKKRASLHVVRGEPELRALDPGGIDPIGCGLEEFGAALRRESHTLKRSLTDPRLFSGIGNAYSDEILHAARLSPLKLTRSLAPDEISRLFEAARATLNRWVDVLGERFRDRFPGPGDITAFRPEFAVHGKFGRPCPVCGHAVQRIVHAENETNYCASCQTGGKVLADRSLSRLLGDNWPRSIEDLEEGSAQPPRTRGIRRRRS